MRGLAGLQRLADLSHVSGRDRRSSISPTCANKIHDIRHVPIRQPPGKPRHRKLRRCASRARRLRPVQDDGDERPWVPRLYDRVAGEAWEYQVVSQAVRAVARCTIVKIDPRSGFAGITVLECEVFGRVIGEACCGFHAWVSQSLEVLRGRERVRWRHVLRAVDDDVAHRAEGDAMSVRTCLEKLRQLFLTPNTKRSWAAATQARREVILNDSSRKVGGSPGG